MKCPKCDQELTKDDIKEIKLRGFSTRHYAYVCKKCEYIIGFGVE